VVEALKLWGGIMAGVFVAAGLFNLGIVLLFVVLGDHKRRGEDR